MIELSGEKCGFIRRDLNTLEGIAFGLDGNQYNSARQKKMLTIINNIRAEMKGRWDDDQSLPETSTEVDKL